MGAEALAGRGAKRQEISIRDPRTCKSYLVGTCPHELFTNTKQDLGPCPKVHSEGQKAEFQLERDQGRDYSDLEYEYLKDVEKYILDCNRRIDAAQRRLERSPEEMEKTKELVRGAEIRKT